YIPAVLLPTPSSNWPTARLSYNEPATTEIYTLSLHDALPISNSCCVPGRKPGTSSNVISGILNASQKRTKRAPFTEAFNIPLITDRKSTRLNSSHLVISYAVFCLKKKNQQSP